MTTSYSRYVGSSEVKQALISALQSDRVDRSIDGRYTYCNAFSSLHCRRVSSSCPRVTGRGTFRGLYVVKNTKASWALAEKASSACPQAACASL